MKRVLCFLVISLALVNASSALTQESRTPDDLKREAASEVDKLQKLTQEMVDSIFSFAELGFQEYETSKYVTGILEKNGFRIERGVAGIPTAWVATYGSGKPVIGFMTDIDCIPRASQKPGVAYHDPIIADAPGHGEGHNSGQAVNVTSAIVVEANDGEVQAARHAQALPGRGRRAVGYKSVLCACRLVQRRRYHARLACRATSSLPPGDTPQTIAGWSRCSILLTERQRIRQARHGQVAARSMLWN